VTVAKVLRGMVDPLMGYALLCAYIPKPDPHEKPKVKGIF
jgi:hypothetical protein